MQIGLRLIESNRPRHLDRIILKDCHFRSHLSEGPLMRLLMQKAGAVGFLVFLVLWIIGSVRGMMLPYPEPPPLHFSSGPEDYLGRRTSQQANFANNLKALGMEKAPLPMLIEGGEVERIQIHDKAAVMTSGTAVFEEDEAKLRAALANYKASIGSEKSTGIAPQRRIAIEVGVHPDKFDSLVADLRKIGNVTNITVEQTDRTGEFRKLHAQRQSLKKYLESVRKLRDGEKLSIDDALRLDQKIKDIENELRPLSDQLGDFLGKESLYHVNVTLAEYQPGDRGDRSYSIPQRIAHAFLWAAVWWLAVALVAALAVGVGVSVWVLRQ